jgi:aspartate/methionine/tyrosine aminotransferase
VVEAGVRALRDGHTRYVAPAGIPALRGAVADAMRARGIDACAERVVVTPGAKLLLFHALLALVQRGDEVLVPDPGYPLYAAATRFAAARPVAYALDGARGFAPDLDALTAAIGPRTRVLVLNAPHNPTGGTLDAATLEALAALVRRHDLVVLADEIYARFVYDAVARGPGESAPSLAALPGMPERMVVVDGCSKAFAMTGWRVGYGLLPRWLVPRVTTLVTNSASCTAPFVQHAAVAALTGPQDAVRAQVAALRARRDQAVAALAAIPGVRCAPPAGAFYAFADARALLGRAPGADVRAAEALLDTQGVACLPGSAYGRRGRGHLRFSFAVEEETLAEALRRVAVWSAGVARA